MIFRQLSSFGILALLAVLMLPTASSQQWSVPVVSISSQDGLCPVESDLQNGLQIIRYKINIILSQVVIPECGDRLWYRVAYLIQGSIYWGRQGGSFSPKHSSFPPNFCH